jgi:hypothetical protein
MDFFIKRLPLGLTAKRLALSTVIVSALSGCGSSEGESSNRGPQADAGSDLSVTENSSVSVQGSGTDSDGSIASYQWQQTSGPSVVLSQANSATVTFVAPEVSSDTDVVLELTVTDNDGASDSDSVDITLVNVNKIPTADAGDTQTVDEGSFVSLAGTGTDIDGSIVAYSWVQTSGVSVTLAASDTATASFTAPDIDANETLTFDFSVTDNDGATATDSVSVMIENATMLLSDISPYFGLAGDQIVVTNDKVVSSSVMVVASGVTIEPDEVDAKQVTFTIPSGLTSGPVFLRNGAEKSTSVWLSVSENGLVEPDQDKLLIDEDGVQYVSDYLIVTVTDDDNSLDNANRLAALVSGTVVGRYDDLNWWQISVEADSLTALYALVDSLTADSTVTNVTVDTISDEDTIDWSQDPDIGEQRERNHLEEGVSLYENSVSLSDEAKALPYFMAVGISEQGIDYTLDDFTGYSENLDTSSSSITIFSENKVSSTTGDADGNHGSNVTGIIAGELGDGGNAGMLAALSDVHSGANIRVTSGASTIAGRFTSSLDMIKSGATVINWSWGIHRKISTDTNSDGTISRDEITDGALQCNGEFVTNNGRDQRLFNAYFVELENFFDTLEDQYPNVVIVTSAGNGSSDAGDEDNRIPSAYESDQLIVVGAHSAGGEYSSSISEDDLNASDSYELSDGTGLPTCFDGGEDVDVKRAYYSNYGERVDIAATGTIVGFQDNTFAKSWGTSYATPVVTQTVALMQSINPNLSPVEIKAMLRSSALPIYNDVATTDTSSATFTRTLTADESSANAGMGARLNIEGALQASLDSLAESTLTKGDTVSVVIDADATFVTQTIEVTLPSEGAVFDKVDVVFLVDVSGSYSDDISTFRTKASDLMDAFSSTGSNVQIGLTSFSEFPSVGASYDYAYQLDQKLTSDYDEVIDALDELTILNGGDYPESQLEALYQTAQSEMGWRSGALPVIFLATDASFHDSDSEYSYPGVGYTETVASLNDRKVTVYGLQSGGTINDVTEIIDATGGEAFSLSRDSAEIIEAVVSALDSSSQDLTITLEAHGDFAGAVQSIVPTLDPELPNGSAIDNVNPGDTISFDVTFNKGLFETSGTHSFAFRLLVNADDVAIIQEIPVVLTINN